VYETAKQAALSKDAGLSDQLLRATVSVMANIAEGYGYKTERQFIHYLNIARASACEVQSLLYVALDSDLLETVHFERLYKLADEAIFLIAGLQRYLRA
jgi:four helix bundle protein